MENKNVMMTEIESAETSETVVLTPAPTQKPKKQKKYKIKTMTTFTWCYWVIMMAFACLLAFEYYWILSTACKSRLDFRKNVFGLPRPKSESPVFGFRLWENIKLSMDVFPVAVLKNGKRQYIRLPELFYNSFSYTIVSTLATILCQFFVAYACAKYNKYKWTIWIHHMVIVLMIVPILGSQAAEIKMMKDLGLYDNPYAFAWLKWSFLGMNFLIFYSSVKGIPQDFWDAASLDGAGHCTLLFKLYMPMLSTILIGLGILAFMGFWNDWGITLYYMPTHPVVAYSLFNIMNSTETVSSGKIPLHFAAALISAIPSIILFICFRNKFLGNISMGGLKA